MTAVLGKIIKPVFPLTYANLQLLVTISIAKQRRSVGAIQTYNFEPNTSSDEDI